MSQNLEKKSTPEIMNLYAEILSELNARNVTRTYNSPVGDYAEWIVAKKLNLQLEHNSQKGYDAIDPNTNIRYQVKSRWEREAKPSAKSRELNVIRNLDDNQFDILVVVIFDSDFGIKEAYEIPHDLVKKYGRYNKHQNGYIVIAMGELLKDTRTRDITKILG